MSGRGFAGTSGSTAQLRDFFLGQVTPLANLQSIQSQISHTRPNQFQHLAIDGLKHPAHLPVAPFVNGEFEKSLFLRITNTLTFVGTRHSI
mgnify:CR=1 FL=1